MRLDRLLSRWNVASRSEAERLVRAGRVRVDGRVERDPARWIDPRNVAVELDAARVRAPEPGSFVTFAYNKPRGEVTTSKDPEGRPTVMAAFADVAVAGLAPVGRLDRASAGLLLVTNDTVFADALTDPRSHVAKVYRVKVKGRPTDADLRAWREESLATEVGVLGPMAVEVERAAQRSAWLRITLREGRNRQIRRRLEARGFEVEHLIRIAIGSLELGDLAKGAHRPLSAAERAALAHDAAFG